MEQPSSSLTVPMRRSSRRKERLIIMVHGRRKMDYGHRRGPFTPRRVEYWSELHREVMKFPFLVVSKAQIEKALKNLDRSNYRPSFEWEVELQSSRGPFQPELSCGSMILSERHVIDSCHGLEVNRGKALNTNSVDQEKRRLRQL